MFISSETNCNKNNATIISKKEIPNVVTVILNSENILEVKWDEALSEIKGKVWEKKVSKLELPNYQKDYKVISNKLVGGQPLIHVFSETQLDNGFTKAEENLEDVFFAKLNELV